jgi:hypothetical protein
MESYIVFKGDTTFNINFELNNYDETDKDITGLIPRLKVWYPGNPTSLLFSGSCTLATATAGTCYYPVVSTDLTISGTFLGELELWNTTTGLQQTWDQFKLVVKDSPSPS